MPLVLRCLDTREGGPASWGSHADRSKRPERRLDWHVFQWNNWGGQVIGKSWLGEWQESMVELWQISHLTINDGWCCNSWWVVCDYVLFPKLHLFVGRIQAYAFTMVHDAWYMASWVTTGQFTQLPVRNRNSPRCSGCEWHLIGTRTPYQLNHVLNHLALENYSIDIAMIIQN